MIIRPLSVRKLYIQWRELEGSYFKVFRSTAPDSNYEVVKDHLDTPFIVDDDVNLSQQGLRYYYRVEGYTGGVKVAEEKGKTGQLGRIDPIANKIIFENQLILKVMRNPPVKILLKRRDGLECPECWNPTTKKVRFANCKACNGTGITFGFHNPVLTNISRDFGQLSDESGMMDGDKVSSSPVSAWISFQPLVSPGDVVVDMMNQRFSINRVVPRTKSQFVIRQIIEMSLLEKGHPAYLTNVEWGDDL